MILMLLEIGIQITFIIFYFYIFLTKDEHKVKHRTILTQGIYVHLRN